MPAETSFILALALLIDALVGYPPALFARIGHPVSWIGALIAALDGQYNSEDKSPRELKRAGMGALILIVGVAAAVGMMVSRLLAVLPLAPLWEAAVASTLLAANSLYRHVAEVADALEEEGLQAGRFAVAKIVGRDPQKLDRHGVARAAIESLAENASDGVVAPALWFLLLGLPGLVAYKAINTADSMIGHLTPRHASFGWASARMDDLVNLPASRLAALLCVSAALVTPGASVREAARAVFRDAPKHRSPNAGWPEAAVAGALGLKLAGPRSYGGFEIKDAYMGSGRAEATAADIRRALALLVNAWFILTALVCLVSVIW